MITFATGCSGIGAPEVAFGDRLGWKCLWCSEIEPFPSAVLKYRWSDVPNIGDFLTIAERIRNDELEAPDVFIAGTPCQAFSVAGLRNSLNDQRGGLTLEYVRIAAEMDLQRIRRKLPETVFVWENVPGVLRTKDNAFGCFLGGLLGLDAPVITATGKFRNYGDLVAERRLAWRVLDAQYFGVAQRRKRVFVMATARPGFSPARGLFEYGAVPRTSPPSREAGTTASADTQGSAGKASWWDGGGIAESITCTSSQQHMPDKQRFQAVIDKHLCKTFGLAPALEANVAKSLAVAVENHPQDSRLKETGDLAPTIPSQAGTGGGNVPLCYSIAENHIGRQPHTGGNGPGFMKNLGYTLNATGMQGVASVGFIRRLTTVECARLQGFPDHHTEIPWKNKNPADCPKSLQYKAYGNAMCVNVIEWLGKRIEQELNNPKPLTLYLPEQMEFDF